jgi:hypothetical protein
LLILRVVTFPRLIVCWRWCKEVWLVGWLTADDSVVPPKGHWQDPVN